MSYQLTRDEILHQVMETLRENDSVLEKLYETLVGGTVYYIGNDNFVVDEEEDISIEEDDENSDEYAWDKCPDD